MSNIDLWKQVEQTNPEHTKTVNQRGGFTAIDAYSRFKRATEVFGPVGKGWGWDECSSGFEGPTGGLWVTSIQLWYVLDGERYTLGPVTSMAEVTGKRTDLDAPKKVLTDCLTKSLSYLGFNADVYLGKFDDSRYVEDRTHVETLLALQQYKGKLNEKTWNWLGARTLEEADTGKLQQLLDKLRRAE